MADTKGFLFFYDWEKPFSELCAEDFKELFLAMIKYQRDGTEPQKFEGIAGVIASFVFPQLDRRAVNMKNGKAGGKKRCENKQAQSQKEAEAAHVSRAYSRTASSVASSQGQAQDKDKDQDKNKDKDLDKYIDTDINPDIDTYSDIDTYTDINYDEVKDGDVTPLSPQGEMTAYENAGDISFFNEQCFENTSEVSMTEEELLENRFNDFWEEYPKKVAMKTARKAYFSLKPDKELSEKMLEALKAQKDCCLWNDMQYIPNPASWIYGRRWEDTVYKSRTQNTASEPLGTLCLDDFFENC